MKHYIDGEFTLEELEAIKSFMQLQGTSDRFEGASIEYDYEGVTLYIQCDMHGCCIIRSK